MFEVNQKVVCIVNKWDVLQGDPSSRSPSKDEVCCVEAVERSATAGIWVARLKGYPKGDWFACIAFAPIDEQQSAVESLVEEINKELLVPVHREVAH